MTRAQRWSLALCAALGLLFGAGASNAACNALAICACTVTTTGVSFGNYVATDAANNDVTGSVTVTCLLTVAKNGSFGLSLSAGSSNSFTTRTMRSGQNALAYNLYTSDARNHVAGDGTGGSQAMTGSIAALLTSITTVNIYGRAPAKQNVPSGDYSDSIVVTVTY